MNPFLEFICAELGIPQEMIAARGLPECEEAKQLEIVETGADGRKHLLVPAAAAAWRRLKAAALADGIDLFIVSAFRSVNRQAEIIRRKLAAGAAIQDVLCVSAPPGFSEHHTGCAVDVSTRGSRALDMAFDKTPAFGWLDSRATAFGFQLSYPAGNRWGYQYEPWHWCYKAA